MLGEPNFAGIFIGLTSIAFVVLVLIGKFTCPPGQKICGLDEKLDLLDLSPGL
jgi:hypothetical protein